ncbi:MAG TPA: PqqD family protein [candidate division Zixibacteria bacterium]|nr:PqqD family protein [candidate division Zixibacteria bacterium]
MIRDDSIVTVPRDVIFQALDGEAVLLNTRTEIYFGLDAVGTRIWQLLSEHRLPAKVVSAMLEEYDIEEAELRSRVMEFIEKLRDKGLVEIA